MREGVCVRCYGLTSEGQAPALGAHVGLEDVHAITEPSTQLALRSFHSGGTAGGKTQLTSGFDRAAQLFEMPDAVKGSAGESDSASIARLMGHTSVDHMTDQAKRSIERTDETRETLRYLLDHGKGSELAGRTAWGAYNAVTEYVDHVYPITQNGTISATRQQSILFVSYQKVKDAALSDALALVN